MKNNQPVTRREVSFSPNAYLVSRTDLKGTITYANDAFVEISGFSHHELIGSSHNLVRHPDMPEAAFRDLWATVKPGLPWRGLVKNAARVVISTGSRPLSYRSKQMAPRQGTVKAMLDEIGTASRAIDTRCKLLEMQMNQVAEQSEQPAIRRSK